MSSGHYILAPPSDAGQTCGQAGAVSPDVHEVLVHAPRALGGDRDGDSVLLQVEETERP